MFDGTEPLPQTRLEVQKHSIKEASQRPKPAFGFGCRALRRSAPWWTRLAAAI